MKRVKVLFISLILFIGMISAVSVNAMEINSASNKFIFDNSVNTKSDILGDLLAMGSTVSIKGNVSGDIISAGQMVDIQNEETTSNIYAAGSRLSISSGKARNIYAFGSYVNINKGSETNGAYLAGRDVFFSGSAKDLYISGANVNIDGNVSGNLVINGDNINISDTAKITGKVEITSSNEPVLPATINKANVKFNKIMPKADERKNEMTGMIILKILGLLTGVLIAIAFTLLNSKYFLSKAIEFKEKLGYNILYGLIAFIVVPIASFIIMFFIITIPISIIVLILYVITLFVAPVYTGVVLGRLFIKKANRYLAAMAGATAVGIVLLIPFVGALGYLFCAFYTLGSIVRNINIGKKEIEAKEGIKDKNETISIEEKTDTPTSEE